MDNKMRVLQRKERRIYGYANMLRSARGAFTTSFVLITLTETHQQSAGEVQATLTELHPLS